MRLALVIASLGVGGAERVISWLANHWASKGHDVFLITLDSSDRAPFYPLNSCINVIHLDLLNAGSSGFLRLFYIARRLFILRQAIKKIAPSRILSFIDITNLTTLIACWGLKIPVVVSERIDPHYYDIPRMYGLVRPFVYRLAQRVVVQTQSAARYFKGMHIDIIANAVEPQKDQACIRPGIRTIVAVGRLCQQKNFGVLIQAFSRINTSHIKLVIYGEGPMRDEWQKLAQDLGIAEKVSFPGVVDTIMQEVSKADIFVFPSLYEGFPNALAEAMALGLPVVASQCSGNTDLVQDGVNGRLFAAQNDQALALILTELIDDEPQRLQLAQKAREVVVQFESSHILSLWDSVFLT